MRTEYVKMRQSNKFNKEWFFKYYLENGGTVRDINMFNQAFPFVPLDSVVPFLDKKFNLTILCDENGDFIKVVE